MKDDPRRFDVGRRGSGMLALVALGLMAAFAIGVFLYARAPVARPAEATASAGQISKESGGGNIQPVVK